VDGPHFLKHSNDTLPKITQLIKAMHNTAPPPTQQMCTLPVQFLQAALIATPTPTMNAPESQLAIPLIVVLMDQTITQWATARYSFYHMNPTPMVTQTPPNTGNLQQTATNSNNVPLGTQNQQLQLVALATNPVPGQQTHHPQQLPNIAPTSCPPARTTTATSTNH